MRIQAENSLGRELDSTAYSGEWEASALQDVYLPISHKIVSRTQAHTDQNLKKEYIVQLKHRFEALKTNFSRDNIRISKAAHRIALLTKGYENRCLSMAAESVELVEKEQKLILERRAHDEHVALVARLASATESAQNEVEKERDLQQTFSELIS